MDQRPSWDDYYANIAWVVSSRSNCLRRRVGALIVVNKRIVSTGYNGTPFGVKNCDEGGCPRCASNTPSQAGLDWCLCVHAEENAIALAARQGTATDGASLYVTYRPCFRLPQRGRSRPGIRDIVYDRPYDYADALEDTYQTLVRESGITMRRHPFSEQHPLPPFALRGDEGQAS